MPSALRSSLLTVGPLLLVALCYGLAAPASHAGRTTLASQAASWPALRSTESQQLAQSGRELGCHQLAATLREQNPTWAVLVKPPFVFASDASQSVLDDLYVSTVHPTLTALQTCYFDTPPSKPVTVFLFTDGNRYREWFSRLQHQTRAEYAGLYLRNERLLVLNLATGAGTLAHELTHALAHADFPTMPEWFDEGLASLHEESEFSASGLELVGVDNWRRTVLKSALSGREAPQFATLLQTPFGTGPNAAEDYAFARYVCLFLQEESLLHHYYRKCRTRAGSHESPLTTLLEITHSTTTTELDARFRKWFQGREAR